jgi:DNA-binding transcriptional ArsR family regulator
MPRRSTPPPVRDPDIAELASVLADRSRVAILDALLDGEPHAIGSLARRAEISAATASSHLERLTRARLVEVARVGRERHVRLAGAEVAELLERLAALAAPATSHSSLAASRAVELRFARLCYDHLAGVVSILVASRLVERGWLRRRDDGFDTTPDLLAWLAARGHPLSDGASRRPLIRACTDWSERVPHIAGRAGAALAHLFLAERWVSRVRDSRALRLTDRGRAALARELGLLLPARRA